MKLVTGYLSEDNMFFDTKVEAIKHDAELIILAHCVSHNLDSEKVFSIIEALADPIMEYVNALKDTEIPSFIQNSHSSQARENLADAFRIEASSTVFEQPSHRHEPMPDLGSGTQSEGV